MQRILASMGEAFDPMEIKNMQNAKCSCCTNKFVSIFTLFMNFQLRKKRKNFTTAFVRFEAHNLVIWGIHLQKPVVGGLYLFSSIQEWQLFDQQQPNQQLEKGLHTTSVYIQHEQKDEWLGSPKLVKLLIWRTQSAVGPTSSKGNAC